MLIYKSSWALQFVKHITKHTHWVLFKYLMGVVNSFRLNGIFNGTVPKQFFEKNMSRIGRITSPSRRHQSHEKAKDLNCWEREKLEEWASSDHSATTFDPPSTLMGTVDAKAIWYRECKYRAGWSVGKNFSSLVANVHSTYSQSPRGNDFLMSHITRSTSNVNLLLAWFRKASWKRTWRHHYFCLSWRHRFSNIGAHWIRPKMVFA